MICRFRPDGFSRKRSSRNRRAAGLGSLRAVPAYRHLIRSKLTHFTGRLVQLRNAPSEKHRTRAEALSLRRLPLEPLQAEVGSGNTRCRLTASRWGKDAWKGRFAITQFCPVAQEKSPHASLSFLPDPTRWASRLGGSDSNITVPDSPVNFFIKTLIFVGFHGFL
jgi:hypothetical protein